jgi:hypothetical protein
MGKEEGGKEVKQEVVEMPEALCQEDRLSPLQQQQPKMDLNYTANGKTTMGDVLRYNRELRREDKRMEQKNLKLMMGNSPTNKQAAADSDMEIGEVIKKEAKPQKHETRDKTDENNKKILGNGVATAKFAGIVGVAEVENEKQPYKMSLKQNKENNSGDEVKPKKTKRAKRTAKWPASLLCPDCGQDIGTATLGRPNDGGVYITWHQMRHTVEKFTCACPDLPWVPKREEKGRVSKNFRLRERHIKTVHWGWKGCGQCVKSFEKVEALARHEKKHTLTFMCDQCEFVASSKLNLRQHSLMSHTEGPAPAPCQDCGKSLPTEAAMKIHRTRVHTSAMCPVCGVTKNAKNLKFHMEQMHVDDSEKKFRCKDCEKGFMTKQSFDSHRMNKHIKERPYICRHGCENRYNDRSNRIAHEKRRHGGSSKLPVKTVLSVA